MNRHVFQSGIMFGILAMAGAAGLHTPRANAADEPTFQKVMVVVLENTDYSEALRQPFLAKLAKNGALLNNFHALAHPSQPNYIALIAGDTLGVKNDSNADLDGSHVGDLAISHGKAWKVYAESYPGSCFTGARSGDYARKHVPFLSFRQVQGSADCDRIVEARQLDEDVKQDSVPELSLYIPNMKNDGHDTDAAFASHWLESSFGPRLQDPQFMKGMLLAVTFDESDRKSDSSNQIYMVLYGEGVKAGSQVATRYDHYSLLRTIEDGLRLGTLGRNDETASAIRGVWK